jgi:hypothetical protein
MAVLRYIYTDHVRIAAHFAPKLEAMATRMFLPRLAMIAKKLYLQDKDQSWASLRIPASSFSEDMQMSLEDDRFADIFWQMDDGTEVPAHKILLTSRCEYFNAIFGSAFKENNSDRISMHEVGKDSFTHLLQYIYTNDVNVSEENFLELLLCADRFLAADMKLRIEQTLEEAMSSENVCDLLLLSERASAPRLRKAAMNCALLPVDAFLPNCFSSISFLQTSSIASRRCDQHCQACEQIQHFFVSLTFSPPSAISPSPVSLCVYKLYISHCSLDQIHQGRQNLHLPTVPFEFDEFMLDR